MGSYWLIVAVLVVAVGAVVAVLLIAKRRRLPVSATSDRLSEERFPLPAAPVDVDRGFSLVDSSGTKLVEANMIPRIPGHAQYLSPSSDVVRTVQHLAADVFKGASSVPNTTIELVFNPSVARGLQDRSYTLMRTRAGETLADAVDAGGQIVGKGRVVEVGKVRQLASGAFQLVSIAVAQSHLADIQRSLTDIKDAVADVLAKHESEDRARISGATDYLRLIADDMMRTGPTDEMLSTKANVIEGIIRDSHTWRNKLKEEFRRLSIQINTLGSADTFGTGNTYRQLGMLIDKASPIHERYALLLQLAAVTNFVTAYMDPTYRRFSRVDPDSESWRAQVEAYQQAAIIKVDALLARAKFNRDETLQLRQKDLRYRVQDQIRVGDERRMQYAQSMEALDRSLARLMDAEGNVRVALAFDGQGNVTKAAMLN